MGLLNLFNNEKDEDTKFKIDEQSWIDLDFNDICYALSNTFKEYRITYNLTQYQLSKILGIKKSDIVKVESGQIGDINFKTLISIWVRLSTQEFDFADHFLSQVIHSTNENYKQLISRRK